MQLITVLKRIQALGRKHYAKPLALKNILPTLILNVTLTWIVLGFFIVPTHTEIIVTRWKQYNRRCAPGIHWHLRFIEQIFKVDMNLQKSNLNTNFVFSKDAQMFLASLDIQYIIQDSAAFFLTIKDPIAYLKQIMIRCFNEGVSQYEWIDLLDQKNLHTIQTTIKQELQHTIALHKMGIELIDIGMPVIHFPKEVKQAIEHTQNTIQQARQSENKAKAQAKAMEQETILKIQQLYEKVHSRKQKQMLAAHAEANKFLKLLPLYKAAPQLTKELLYLQMLKKSLVKNPNQIDTKPYQESNTDPS